MSSTWKAASGVILVFILGWFGGALSTIIIRHHELTAALKHDPEPLATMLEKATTHGLGLSGDQKAQIHALLLDNIRQRLQLQKIVQPQVKGVNRQTVDQINALLTPAQQQKFRDNLFLIKVRTGHNPLSTGPDDKTDLPANPPPVPATNASAAAAPAT